VRGCHLCNTVYTQVEGAKECVCDRTEVCNTTAGKCDRLSNNNRTLCSGVCEPRRFSLPTWTLTHCQHCNEHSPEARGVPKACLCSIFESCNETMGVCGDYPNATGQKVRLCSGQCQLEQASTTMMVLMLFYFVLLIVAIMFEKWWNRRPESQVIIYS